jgi:sulfite reductase (NADPH) hemoprotein beta-component
MRVYNRYGRRDNKYKARIKILVRAMTAAGFRERVEDEWAHLKDGPSTLTAEEIERVRAHFEPPSYPSQADGMDELARIRLENSAFSRWVERNVRAHRQPGYAAVTLSTKVPGIPPGDVTDLQMDAVAQWADSYGFGEIRISHEQNFVLPDVPVSRLSDLYAAASAMALGEANIGLISDIVCCPGGDYCSLANAKSIPVAEAIQRELDSADYEHDLGPIDLNISGCMNACGHHHVGNIGILGVDKKGQEFYQISLGGHSGHSGIEPSLGQIVGPSCSRAEVTEVIGRILDVYLEARQGEEAFIHCFRRIGIEPFKERIYATAE